LIVKLIVNAYYYTAMHNITQCITINIKKDYTMPTYNYSCNACNKLWEESHTIAERNAPVELPCPHCRKKNQVIKTMEGCTPGLGADFNLTPDKASGGRWKEVIAKVKHGAPKRLHKNIEGLGGAGQSWKG